MWLCQPIATCVSSAGARWTHYDKCIFHGTRRKQQALLSCNIDLADVALVCDASHTHAPWGFKPGRGFDTASEAANTPEFCKAIMKALLKASPLPPPSSLSVADVSFTSPACSLPSGSVDQTLSKADQIIAAQPLSKRRRAAVAATLGKQQRGRIIPNNNSEYEHIMSVTVRDMPVTNDKRCLL